MDIQIEIVNARANREIKYKPQTVEWRDVQDIIDSGEGDCTCISQVKRHRLLDLYPDAYLQRCWVMEGREEVAHMVCVVPYKQKRFLCWKGKEMELVLDNRSSLILDKPDCDDIDWKGDGESNKFFHVQEKSMIV